MMETKGKEEGRCFKLLPLNDRDVLYVMQTAGERYKKVISVSYGVSQS